MTREGRPHIQLRFPLFGKLITGFIVVILFMVASMLTILLQLRPLVEGKTDFRGAEIAQDIGRTFGAVEESARRYLASGESKDLQTFLLLGDKFTTDSETLKVLVDSGKHDIKATLDSMILDARAYIDLVAAAEGGGQRVVAPETAARGRLLSDAVRLDVSRVREYYLGTMVKSLKSLNTQTTNSIAGAYIILGLSLVIGIALGILIAKTLTRPIQALKAGSEKVGEGQYETVPVTTNDEVAELTVAFNLMSDKLRQLDEMRMQMMSEISHEMRTPLQVIKAGCYSIIHAKDVTPLSGKQRDAVGMIHQATNRINQFVNSFLDIAKMEAGLMKFRFEAAKPHRSPQPPRAGGAAHRADEADLPGVPRRRDPAAPAGPRKDQPGLQQPPLQRAQVHAGPGDDPRQRENRAGLPRPRGGQPRLRAGGRGGQRRGDPEGRPRKALQQILPGAERPARERKGVRPRPRPRQARLGGPRRVRERRKRGGRRIDLHRDPPGSMTAGPP